MDACTRARPPDGVFGAVDLAGGQGGFIRGKTNFQTEWLLLLKRAVLWGWEWEGRRARERERERERETDRQTDRQTDRHTHTHTHTHTHFSP